MSLNDEPVDARRVEGADAAFVAKHDRGRPHVVHRCGRHGDPPESTCVAEPEIDVLAPLSDEGEVEAAHGTELGPRHGHVAAPTMRREPRQLPRVGRHERRVPQRPPQFGLDHPRPVVLVDGVDRSEEEGLAVIRGAIGRHVIRSHEAVGIEEHEQVARCESGPDVASQRGPEAGVVAGIIETAPVPHGQRAHRGHGLWAAVADDDDLAGVVGLVVGRLDHSSQQVGPAAHGHDDADGGHAPVHRVVGNGARRSNPPVAV